jgi:hypothetical protein
VSRRVLVIVLVLATFVGAFVTLALMLHWARHS